MRCRARLAAWLGGRDLDQVVRRLSWCNGVMVAPADLTWVHVRPNAQAIARRRTVVTEEGLSRLMQQPSRTAAVLLPPPSLKDPQPPYADGSVDLLFDE